MSVNDLFNLSGTVALVTDGSRGPGLAIAIVLGEAGAAVAITSRQEQSLVAGKAALDERGIACLATACDVTDAAQVDTAIAAVLARFGRLDILVNSEGLSADQPVAATPVERWRRAMETNVTGCFLMSRGAGAIMQRAARGGVIVNIAPIAMLAAADTETLDAVGSSASKGAVAALTRDLAVKWARHRIRVNAIAPRRADGLQGAALFLASPASAAVNGHVLVVDGGTTAP